MGRHVRRHDVAAADVLHPAVFDERGPLERKDPGTDGRYAAHVRPPSLAGLACAGGHHRLQSARRAGCPGRQGKETLALADGPRQIEGSRGRRSPLANRAARRVCRDRSLGLVLREFGPSDRLRARRTARGGGAAQGQAEQDRRCPTARATTTTGNWLSPAAAKRPITWSRSGSNASESNSTSSVPASLPIAAPTKCCCGRIPASKSSCSTASSSNSAGGRSKAKIRRKSRRQTRPEGR